MKKIAVLLASSILYLSSGYAQLKNVPAAVTEGFKKRYPVSMNIQNVKWMKDGSAYAARFVYNGDPYTSRFTEQGAWLDETRKLNFGELRNNVRNAFSQSKFATWRAYEVNQIQERNKEAQYRILIRSADDQPPKYLYYDGRGQMMKEASM